MLSTFDPACTIRAVTRSKTPDHPWCLIETQLAVRGTDDLEEAAGALGGDRHRRIGGSAAGGCGVHTKIQAHLVAVKKTLVLGLKQRKIFVGARRTEMFHGLGAAFLRIHDLHGSRPEGGAHGADIRAHENQSNRPPRNPPP